MSTCSPRSWLAYTMLIGAVVWLTAAPSRAEVLVERVSCLNLPNCVKLSNGRIEVVVTTDVGPRIIRYALVGGENILSEIGGSREPRDRDRWQLWGGHRLWIAPEGKPRSYGPDNDPITHAVQADRSVRFDQPVEKGTGIQKSIIVSLDADGSGVSIRHILTNKNRTPFELAPWGVTIMAGGGTAIVPQEPYRSHDDEVLPARPLALWYYTDLSDARFKIGPKFVRLSTDAARKEPQKIGMGNKQGWAAYARKGQVFIKRYGYQDDRIYPDFGSNTEVYTSSDFLEIETLGPMITLAPDGAVEHVERWFLFNDITVGDTEQTIDAALQPLLAKTKS